ncbi:TolC family outer membrane protein [Kaarinaea lacus]
MKINNTIILKSIGFRNLLFVAVSGLLLIPGYSSAENLEQIYALAKENDPQFKSAKAALDAAYESVKITRGNFLPDVNLSASYADNDTDAVNVDEGGTTSYSINLKQPIYRSDFNATHSRNKNYVLQAEADFATAEQNLILRVATQYFAVLGAQDNYEFSQAELRANSRQLEQTKQRFEVGLVAITDVHEAQARYDLSVAQNIEAENKLNNETESLRAITGKYISDFASLKSESPLTPPEPDDIEYWTKMALEKNQFLQSSQHFAAQSRDSVNVQKAAHKPTLDFTASKSRSDSDSGTYDNTSVGIQFGMNLFNGGSTSASVRQAEHTLTQALETLEEAHRATQRNVRNSFLSVRSAVSQVKAYNQAVISSQSRLKASEAGFDVGTRTTVDVLDARRELFNSQRQYSRSRYDYILEKLRLEQFVGDLNEEDVKNINSWLQ